jgi:catechol 2,3-dioxygenase-like lactoylglutathione lyase family enzyme
MTVRTLGRTTLLVHDYDKALAFYRDRLGFRVLHDERTPDGGRYLHIGLTAHGDEPPVGLWLMQATGDDAALVGRQAGSHPFLVLYTDDCDATVQGARALESGDSPTAGDVRRRDVRAHRGSLRQRVAG